MQSVSERRALKDSMQSVREGCLKDSMQCVREGCPRGVP